MNAEYIAHSETQSLDTKALFGDVETHTNSVLPQVESYVHRFGPGLVLYWFGHAPLSRLGDGRGDVSIAGGELPKGGFLLPTGEVHGRRRGGDSKDAVVDGGDPSPKPMALFQEDG